jgi:hypothetical protein
MKGLRGFMLLPRRILAMAAIHAHAEVSRVGCTGPSRTDAMQPDANAYPVRYCIVWPAQSAHEVMRIHP